MAAIVVRGLEESVKSALAARARKHGRSMEAEVREILTQAASRPNIGMALMQTAREAGGVDELPVPSRDERARSVDFA
ncbi:FitA-like ribbon-helix-helix domain-containing protein [Brevibacterium luteolum]|uniref:FitA-like ribbon-helix-helix domain-containing protein n=1 Tax=Brevibacterium luteolum TaxID=199591 RepID=UPI0021B04F75|nr:Arc family DNA-binding protein [Brevibacterium luteolum]MCT1873797.1 Arc family DNA-binding protein [Brevibacterium luteolum]MCT1889487.1 Arc family DNA-binding protein [Brevibacterium luteolum]MCT1893540.1 Arc family DNA-binding protein [Brevibacterium luteolum]MCT1924389.1 Arc family DNA-binding protein [Brevibacterium luteolum]